MICDNCKKNEATVFVKQTDNNNTTEMYLCSQCAAEKGLYGIMPTKINISDFFPGFFGTGSLQGGAAHTGFTHKPEQAGAGAAAASAAAGLQAEHCPKCGMTLADFQKRGKMGCDECYGTFGKKMEPLFKRLHGSIYHKGKMPAAALKQAKSDAELETLRQELAAAIKEEAYEQAAVVRDKIRKLEAKKAKG